MVFNWSLSDSKSPQVSRTILSILAVLNDSIVLIVSTRPPNSKSPSPFNNPLVTVPKAPITIGIIVTFMFHSFFFQFPSKVDVLIFLFIFFQFYSLVSRDSGWLALWVECSPMVQENWVQSQVTSYQRDLKWYLISSCLTFSSIRYVSRVKWTNPGKGVAPSSTLWCWSYWKGKLRVALD